MAKEAAVGSLATKDMPKRKDAANAEEKKRKHSSDIHSVYALDERMDALLRGSTCAASASETAGPPAGSSQLSARFAAEGSSQYLPPAKRTLVSKGTPAFKRGRGGVRGRVR